MKNERDEPIFSSVRAHFNIHILLYGLIFTIVDDHHSVLDSLEKSEFKFSKINPPFEIIEEFELDTLIIKNVKNRWKMPNLKLKCDILGYFQTL